MCMREGEVYEWDECAKSGVLSQRIKGQRVHEKEECMRNAELISQVTGYV